jgi:hypothetical protein
MGTGGYLFHLGAAGAFAGFVVLAVVLGARTRTGANAKRRAGLLIGYALLVSCLAGFSQRDLYPFTHWQLLANPVTPVWHYPLLMGVDERGAEHRIDYRAYDPMSFAELMGFFNRRFLALAPDAQDRIGAYLLERINGARDRVLAGRDIRPTGRWFGPLRAPYFDLSPARWRVPGDVPPTPVVSLRLYQQVWEIERRTDDSSTVLRQLVWEGPAR